MLRIPNRYRDASRSEARYQGDGTIQRHDDTSPARRLIDAWLAGDAPAATGLLAAGATFHSPIRDYEGRDVIAAVWNDVAGVIAAARPTSVHEAGGETAVFFAGTILDRPVDGVLRVLADGDGRPHDVTLMVRPLAALKAGIAQIAPRLPAA